MYLAGSVHGSKSVRVDALTHCELMGDLEQGVHAEDLGEVGTNTSKHGVVKEDIALNLSGQTLDCAGVGQVELRPALGERFKGISYRGRNRVGKEDVS